ncbi:MAG TPA: signal recognition particle-docking protein FtsY [Actinomycetota bacterium]|nr:signal recognition particle-docking protein FtsY [Actinomycetota bacterium]
MDVLIIGLFIVLVAVVVAGIVAAVSHRRRHPAGARLSPTPPAEAPAPARRRSDGLGARARALLSGGAPSGDEWTRLEELLLKADVGPAAASRMVRDIRDQYEVGADPFDPEDLLRNEIVGILGEDGALRLPSGRLGVVLVVGVNGAGKTTTIGKLAARLAREGRTVSVANTDTFRAAASEQLDAWARRANVQLIAQQRGADPGAVAFDAVASARARNVDVLIVDTAGRLHTRTPLMDELQKVKRVLEKAAGHVDEVLLVLDATTGQNGIAQAQAFASAVDVTGVALAKLDGTARGGIVLAVREALGVPVKLVGTGERIDDLQAFDSRAFAERILGG